MPAGPATRPRVGVFPLGGGRLAVAVLRLEAAPRPAGGAVPACRLERMRRAEHAGGRRALRAGLRALGVVPGPLGRRPDGAPEPPPGALVTIAHRAPHVVAAAWTARPHAPGRPARLSGLGVDIERAGGVPMAAMHLLCGSRELDALRREPAWLDPTRLFAAKEAVFKALPPCGVRFRPRGLPVWPLHGQTGVCVLACAGRTITAYVTTRRVGDRWIALCVACG